jgi:hypothetical protein
MRRLELTVVVIIYVRRRPGCGMCCMIDGPRTAGRLERARRAAAQRASRTSHQARGHQPQPPSPKTVYYVLCVNKFFLAQGGGAAKSPPQKLWSHDTSWLGADR